MISSSTTLLERSLTTAAAELKYEQSSHLVDILAKDEDHRRVRFEASIREDDVDELRDLLSQESDRSAAFEKLVGQNLLRAEGAEARMATLQEELRSKEQQLSTLAAERAALEHVATDATTALTEKLVLTRELSILKPQLEHLQSQATATESLMAEKLSLQRELAEVQCDLENAKREAKRALAKRRNTGAEIAQEEQMDELRRQLAKEKRARQRAEEAMDTTQSDAGVDEVRRELAREKRARQKAEDRLEEALNATQIEEVRSDLLKEKKAKDKLREKLEKLKAELDDERRKTTHTSSGVSDLETETLVKSLREQLESARSELEAEKQKSLSRPEAATSKSTIDEDTTQELRDQLAVEKRERARIEKALQASTTAFEAQKATLEDKLNQFRDKLRSTKDKLKATEAELTQVRETSAGAATVRPSDLFVSKVAKKRNQAQLDPDANALGTPGDGPAKKTSRRNGPSGVGDKSTFSITPFLSRTTSVAPESEDDDAEVASPTVAPRQPLSEQPNTSSNIQKPKKTAGRKLKTAPVLQVVAEEVEESRPQGQENASNLDQPLATKVKTKTADGPEKLPGKRQKLRKSIHDFSSFNPEPELKKKRKLAGLGKTLFDDDDNDALPAKSLPAKGLFGGMSLGGKGRKGGLLGAPKLGAGLSCAAESNAAPFSPLKRTRRNLDDTLRG